MKFNQFWMLDMGRKKKWYKRLCRWWENFWDCTDKKTWDSK